MVFKNNLNLISRIKFIILKLLVIIFAPIVLLITLLRPFIVIRFGSLRSDRIGHFTADTEAYLCAKDEEKSRIKTLDIIGCHEPVCNLQILKMWSRTFKITRGELLWRILDSSCQYWTRSTTHHIQLYARYKDYPLFLKYESHLKFTNTENQKGLELIKRLGIPEGSPWICIHNRDSKYLDDLCKTRVIHHDYRNFSIESMRAAAEVLTDRGYYVIRVGDVVEEKLISENVKIIDYANSSMRSDFLDIFLLSKCMFFLGNDSGLWCVPWLFKRPLVKTNFSLIIESNYPCYIIFKRFYHTKRKVFLSLREIFESGLASAGQTYMYKQADIELINNTPEEITDIAIEVDDRMKKKWNPHPDDDELQKKFWDIYLNYTSEKKGVEIYAKVGSAFLRKYKYLLN